MAGLQHTHTLRPTPPWQVYEPLLISWLSAASYAKEHQLVTSASRTTGDVMETRHENLGNALQAHLLITPKH